MNRYLSLIGVLAVAGCAATAPPREHVAAAPQFFDITPVRSVPELLRLALAASPPVEPGEFRPADLVELTTLDPTIKLDIRYATTRNFLGTPLYSQARAFLQRPAAEAVVRVQRALAEAPGERLRGQESASPRNEAPTLRQKDLRRTARAVALAYPDVT